MGLWNPWFDVRSSLPSGQADAIYCPSYSLARDGEQLTAMSSAVLTEGARLLKLDRARWLVLATAFHSPGSTEGPHTSEHGARLDLVRHAGANFRACRFLGGATSTYDETEKLLVMVTNLNVRSLIVVAEYYHLRRAMAAIRRALPDLKLFGVPVRCLRYDAPYHPSWLRRVTMEYEFLWALWNFVFFYLTPLLMSKRRKPWNR